MIYRTDATPPMIPAIGATTTTGVGMGIPVVGTTSFGIAPETVPVTVGGETFHVPSIFGAGASHAGWALGHGRVDDQRRQPLELARKSGGPQTAVARGGSEDLITPLSQAVKALVAKPDPRNIDRLHGQLTVDAHEITEGHIQTIAAAEGYQPFVIDALLMRIYRLRPDLRDSVISSFNHSGATWGVNLARDIAVENYDAGRIATLLAYFTNLYDYLDTGSSEKLSEDQHAVIEGLVTLANRGYSLRNEDAVLDRVGRVAERSDAAADAIILWAEQAVDRKSAERYLRKLRPALLEGSEWEDLLDKVFGLWQARMASDNFVLGLLVKFSTQDPDKWNAALGKIKDMVEAEPYAGRLVMTALEKIAAMNGLGRDRDEVEAMIKKNPVLRDFVAEKPGERTALVRQVDSVLQYAASVEPRYGCAEAVVGALVACVADNPEIAVLFNEADKVFLAENARKRTVGWISTPRLLVSLLEAYGRYMAPRDVSARDLSTEAVRSALREIWERYGQISWSLPW